MSILVSKRNWSPSAGWTGTSRFRSSQNRRAGKFEALLFTILLDNNLPKALPEILRNAAKRGVIVEQNDQAFEDLFGESK